RLMQDVPSPRPSAHLFSSDAIEQIVAAEHDEGHTRDGPARQPDQPSEGHHRGSNHEDDPHGQAVEIDVEAPAELDQREIDQDQQRPTDQEEAAKLLDPPLRAIEKSRKPREKDKSRREKMRAPTGEEERGFHDIAGIEAAGSKEVARMIKGHDRHDEAPQDVNGNYPCRSVTPHTSCRGNWRNFNPLQCNFLMHRAA